MKTTVLNKHLQQIRDALPKRITDRMSGNHDRSDHLDIPLVGWVGCNYYGEPEPVSVFLCFTGVRAGRTRTYQIKNGVLKTERLVKVAVEKFDKRDAFEREYAEQQAESDRQFAEARRLGPIVFKKVRTGRRYRKENDTHLAGGFNLYTKKGGLKGEIWAQTEDTVSGTIPVDDLDVATFNSVMAILNGHEFRILDKKRG